MKKIRKNCEQFMKIRQLSLFYHISFLFASLFIYYNAPARFLFPFLDFQNGERYNESVNSL